MNQLLLFKVSLNDSIFSYVFDASIKCKFRE